MSDSGKTISDCPHGKAPDSCVPCLHAELERARTRLTQCEHWIATRKQEDALDYELEQFDREEVRRIGLVIPPKTLSLVELCVKEIEALRAEVERSKRGTSPPDGTLRAAVRAALLQVADSVAKHTIQRSGFSPDDPCFLVDLREAEARLVAVVTGEAP
jgi:hypothetical protein